MSTKNLARTVIEGGRTHYSSWARHLSNRQARAQEGCLLREVEGDRRREFCVDKLGILRKVKRT